MYIYIHIHLSLEPQISDGKKKLLAIEVVTQNNYLRWNLLTSSFLVVSKMLESKGP